MPDDPTRRQALADGLATLEPMLQPDGFSLSLHGIHDDEVAVCLDAAEDACVDCLMPEEMLQDIVLQALREQDPSVRSVTLDIQLPAEPL